MIRWRARHRPAWRTAFRHLHRGRAEATRLEAWGDNGHLLPGDSPWIAHPRHDERALHRRRAPRVGAILFSFRNSASPLALGGQTIRRRVPRRQRADRGSVGESAIRRSRRRSRAEGGRVRACRDAVELQLWTRANLRRYADAKAIGRRDARTRTDDTVQATRETYWDSERNGWRRPLTVISVTNAPPRRSSAVRWEARAGRRRRRDERAGRVHRSANGSAGNNVVGIVRGEIQSCVTPTSPSARTTITRLLQARRSRSIRTFNTVVRQRGADDRQPTNVSDADGRRFMRSSTAWHRVHGGGWIRSTTGRRRWLRLGDRGSSRRVLREAHEAETVAPVRVAIPRRRRVCTARSIFSDHPRCRVIHRRADQHGPDGRGEPIDNPPGRPERTRHHRSRRLSTELGDLAESDEQERDAAVHVRLCFRQER